MYELDQIITTKKPHVCGSDEWKIVRVGADIKLECQGCGHVITVERPKALKMITKIEKKADTLE